MKRQKFVIFDGNAIIHRAYHAIPPMTTQLGELVNAVYGYTSMMLKILAELKPEYTAVAFDMAAPTFRHQEYADYKATRAKGPDDLYAQFQRVRQVTEALSIPIFEKEGFEADDVIGALSCSLPKDLDVIIVTGDLDELQLVSKNVKVYTMRRGFSDTVLYDLKAVEERYGLTPEEFVDYKALKGDSSDNIPGVAGIGEKTACTLIRKYKTIESLYNHLEELQVATREKLENGRESAFLSKKLSKIECGIAIEINLEAAKTHHFDRQKVFGLFRELGFKSLLSRLPEEKLQFNLVDEIKEKPSKLHLKTCCYRLTDGKKLESLIQTLEKADQLSIDTETDSVIPMKANLVGISFAVKEEEAFYIPLAHKKGVNLKAEAVLEKLRPILENEKVKKIGHNLKYDCIVLARSGIRLEGIYFDTMVAAYLLNQNLRSPKLDDIAFSELGIEKINIEELIGRGKDQICFDETDCQIAYRYACEDADVALRLFHHLEKELLKKKLKILFQEIEMPLVPILAKMEMAGINVNSKILKEISVEFQARIAKLELEIFNCCGEKFNINSPSQLQKILFEKLALAETIEDKKELKKLKTGGYSTGANELEKLAGSHQIIEKILRYRELTKLKSTYVETLPKLVNAQTGRIHTSFNQAITATGRLSSSDPNLQNIPIRSEEGREIRKAFVAPSGKRLLAIDYSQIELRVIAHMAADPRMIETFHRGEDIHAATAAEVAGVPLAAVTPEMRRKAKAVNFGIIYGVSPHGLKQSTGMTREEATQFINKYFAIYEGVRRYTQEIVEKARLQRYVETLFGRRRYLPEINSSNFAVRNQAERMALNMPIQGTAADIIKLAMIKIDDELARISPDSKMLLQVHDELVFEVPEGEIEAVKEKAAEIMESIVKLKVPLVVSAAIGRNWAEAK